MAQVITNNWTQGTPLTANGNTGIQSIKHIPAVRVFIKAAESTSAAPVNSYAAYSFKTNGIAPTGWTDLGIVEQNAKITYTKTTQKVKTGIDNITRAVYVSEKAAMFDFELDQLDDYVLQQLGFNSSVITAGSTVNFQIGQEDVVTYALLMVYANKIDGKEVHWYHPSAIMAVTFNESNSAVSVKVSADLIGFTAAGATKSSLISCTIFS